MSSGSNALPTGFSLLGGLPQRIPDLPVSIVFVLAYALLTPLAYRRIARRRTRLAILIRPCIVLLVRIATYIIRALQASGKATSTGLFIAEQVLLLLGIIPLCEPLVSLTRYHIRRNWIPTFEDPEEGRPASGTDRLLKLLEYLLFAAVIIGATAGGLVGNALDNPDQLPTLRRLRYATYGLTLAVIIGGPLLATLSTISLGLPRRPVVFLYACALCLGLATCYRIEVSVHPVSPISHGAKAGFYLLNSLPELVCTAFYLAVDLDALFDVNEGVWKEKVEKQMKKGRWVGPYRAKGEEAPSATDLVEMVPPQTELPSYSTESPGKA